MNANLLASHKSFSSGECRNDLNQTTTGIGYEFRKTVPFPPETFKQRRNAPLPSRLTQSPANPLLVGDVYTTTSQEHFSPQPHHTVLEHPQSRKAPGHWRVHYNQDLTEKLNEHPQRRALTIGNQKTEVGDSFSSQALDPSLFPKDKDRRLPDLADHMEGGPTKELVSTTENVAMKSLLHHSSDPSALARDDPYISSSHYHHRTFTKEELKSYPKKDVTSYWQWEGFPKAWGYSSLASEKPQHPIKQEEGGEMRDRTWFRQGTSIERIPPSLAPPPNKGLNSLYRDSYREVTAQQRKNLFATTVTSPPLETLVGGVTTGDMLEATPNMYKTLYASQSEEATFLA